jgi:hypothetical protein
LFVAYLVSIRETRGQRGGQTAREHSAQEKAPTDLVRLLIHENPSPRLSMVCLSGKAIVASRQTARKGFRGKYRNAGIRLAAGANAA